MVYKVEESFEKTPTAAGVPALTLRPALPADDGFLFRVYAGSGAGGADAPGMGLLRRQFDREDRRYRDAFPAADYFVVLCGGRPVGRLYVDHGRRRIRILDLALLPEHRNGGLGSLLLASLLLEADWMEKPLQVRVPRSPRALKWVEGFGFRRIGGGRGRLVLERAPAGCSS